MLKNRIKMVLIMLISFVVVDISSSLVFLADSPRINPIFITKMKQLPSDISTYSNKLVASIFNFKLFSPTNNSKIFTQSNNQNHANNLIFKKISNNVSAAEDENGNMFIQVSKGTKYRIIGTIIINGKEYPKIEFINN